MPIQDYIKEAQYGDLFVKVDKCQNDAESTMTTKSVNNETQKHPAFNDDDDNDDDDDDDDAKKDAKLIKYNRFGSLRYV